MMYYFKNIWLSLKVCYMLTIGKYTNPQEYEKYLLASHLVKHHPEWVKEKLNEHY